MVWYAVSSLSLKGDIVSCVGFCFVGGLLMCCCVCVYVGWYVTFFPYRLRSSAFRVMYFWPAMWKPVLMTFFGSEESLNAPTTIFTSAGESWKFWEAAQTLVPSAPNMAALSTVPEPTRLEGEFVSFGMDGRGWERRDLGVGVVNVPCVNVCWWVVSEDVWWWDDVTDLARTWCGALMDCLDCWLKVSMDELLGIL